MKRLLAVVMLAAPLSAAASAHATLHARRVVSPDGGTVVDAAAGDAPSSAHPDGTVIVSTTVSVEELDIARWTVVHAQRFGCEVLRRRAGHLLGVCGGDIVAFGASVGVRWRAHWPGAAGDAPHARDVFWDGTGPITATFEAGGGLLLRIATPGGVPSPEVQTNIPLVDGRAQATISLHGDTVVGRVEHPMPWAPRDLFVLSADRRRVAHRLHMERGEETWDDGAHLHIRAGDASVAGAAGPGEGRSIPWLRAGRDYTLGDDLRPIRSAPLAPEAASAAPEALDVEGLDGSRTAYELDVGSQHFWMTRGCCGAQGGLFVAKD